MTLNNSDKNMVGILGSGFGLYGYLPAVAINRNNSIVLINESKHKFDARPELAEFKENVHWLDKDSFYEQIDTLVVCLSPEGQFSSVTCALNYPNIRYLALEKPLAINPAKSHELLGALIKSGKHYRIGYNFQYTNWGKALLDMFNDPNPRKVKIDWYFRAHHYVQNLKNWKRYNSTGGGTIRFYGIHLIALLAHVGSCKILSSSSFSHSDDEIYRWCARFEVNSIHTMEIDIDAKASVNKFVIETEAKSYKDDMKTRVSMNDPFDEYVSSSGVQDRRVGVVKPVLDSLKEDDQQYYWNNIYYKVNSLWEQIENVNSLSV